MAVNGTGCGRIRVVIVDDAQPLRALLRSTLNRDGRFDVVGEAADGREGVQVVLSSVPDVVLLDLAMPVMDGLEAIPRIVAGSPGTRIVVLSGFEARQVEEEVIELGAAAYLPKGVRPGELTETLTRLCVTGPMCAAHGRRHGVPPPADAASARPPPATDAPDTCLHLVDVMEDYAICTIDVGGRVVSWNRGAQRVKGYPDDEIMGSHIARFYLPCDAADGMPESLLARAATAGSAATEGWRIRNDGSRFWADVVLMALRDDAGALTGYLEVTRDTTERRNSVDTLEQMNRELEQRTDQLIRSNGDLEQLASVLSHDLNEPLRVVGGFAKLLAEDCDERLDDTGRVYVRNIVQGVVRMRALIEDLVAYARVGADTAAGEPVDCAEVMRAVGEALSLSIDTAGAELTVGELPVVSGRWGDLFQLFQNLVGNALKFVAAGVRPRVAVDAHAEGEGWHVTVIDNGIGIEPDKLERAFRMFQRLHPVDAYAGTGIGLAICQKVVQRGGGRIWIESAPGGGSVVHLTLPAWMEDGR